MIDVSVNGGANRPALGPSRTANANVPAHTFTLALDATGDWHLAKPLTPHWNHLFGDAKGKWYTDTAGNFCLTLTGSKTVVLELRGVSSVSGPVFYWPRKGNYGATLYDGQGSWKPTSTVQPRTWIGVAAKGGGGAVAGAEVTFGAVVKVAAAGTGGGCSFAISTGRLGAVAGFSGGIAFVFATGFESPQQFAGFTSSGADFALACGVPIAKAVNPRWAKVAAAAGKFDNGLALVESLVKGSGGPKAQSIRNELPGIAKTISQAALVDYDEKNMTILDIPMCGAGAEAGIYYGWSNTRLLSTW